MGVKLFNVPKFDIWPIINDFNLIQVDRDVK